MHPSVPTPDQLLRSHCSANGFCHWPVQGGSITISSDDLRKHLEAAYDPTCPDWPQFVELPEPDDDDDDPSLSAAERNPTLR
jgi:hypothetical protein